MQEKIYTDGQKPKRGQFVLVGEYVRKINKVITGIRGDRYIVETEPCDYGLGDEDEKTPVWCQCR